MKRKMTLFGLLLSCICMLLAGCGVPKKAQRAELKQELVRQSGQEKDILEVTFFNVGKGDAILISVGEENMLIDTGFDETAEQLLKDLKEREVEKLDYLVITHFDKDHVGGADKVLDAIEVDSVLQSDYEASGKQYKEYKKALKQLELKPELVTDTKEFELGEAQVLIYPPQQESYELEDNDWSLVVSLTYEEKSFLFTGDCEEARLAELLEQDEFPLHHSVLKAPHHGIRSLNTIEFLNEVSPEVAVITCCDEWKTAVVQKTLYGLGAKAYLTSRGTVTCMTNGTALFVEQ